MEYLKLNFCKRSISQLSNQQLGVTMVFQEIRQRSDFLGTQVITCDAGKKLGVVSQLWVDVNQQAVVALSLRPSLLYGNPQLMLLSSIRQIEDIILVDNDDVIEERDVGSYSSLINYEVVTETGELLGKVRGFKFDIDNGNLTSLILASIGFPLIPDQVVSTYELPVDEIISSGCDRLIVFEGSEERLIQLSVGILERLGIGSPPWEHDEDDYISPIRGDDRWNGWDDVGGISPSPRPRQPTPNPISDEAAATPD